MEKIFTLWTYDCCSIIIGIIYFYYLSNSTIKVSISLVSLATSVHY